MNTQPRDWLIILGIIPGMEIFDVIDGLICLAEGDMLCVGLSALSAVPVIGWAGAIGKSARISDEAVDATNAGIRTYGSFTADALRVAAQVPDRNGFTQVGRALQKHSDREGSAFAGQSTGAAVARNEQGLQVLDEILSDPRGHTEVLDRVTNIWDSSGRGVRYRNDGSFMGFLEPR